MDDTILLSLFVPGKPGVAGSKRAFIVTRKRDGKQVAVVTDDSSKSKDWKGDVKRFANDEYAGPLLEGPLRVAFTFYLARPQWHFGKSLGKPCVSLSAPAFPIVKPDLLKFSRAVEDALTGVVWKDDAQIVTEVLMKRYVDSPMQTPGVLIQVRREQ